MRYVEAKERVIDLFNTHDHVKRAERGEKHTQSHVVEKLSNGSSILIYFPGYKSAPNRYGGYTYDYRVDLLLPREGNFQTTLSHVNIIVDICNKCLHAPSFKPKLIKVLNDLYVHGTSGIDVNSFTVYNQAQVHDQLINEAQKTHSRLGKTYNKDGNKHALTFEELFHSIMWISLQEDLNYPMPRFEGRRMSFSRYLESIWQLDNSHNLAEVIERALSHSRPIPWSDKDYPPKIAD